MIFESWNSTYHAKVETKDGTAGVRTYGFSRMMGWFEKKINLCLQMCLFKPMRKFSVQCYIRPRWKHAQWIPSFSKSFQRIVVILSILSERQARGNVKRIYGMPNELGRRYWKRIHSARHRMKSTSVFAISKWKDMVAQRVLPWSFNK